MSRFGKLLWNCDCVEMAMSEVQPHQSLALLFQAVLLVGFSGGRCWDALGRMVIRNQGLGERRRKQGWAEEENKIGPWKSWPAWQGALEWGYWPVQVVAGQGETARPLPPPSPGIRGQARHELRWWGSLWLEQTPKEAVVCRQWGSKSSLGGTLSRAPLGSATKSFLTSLSLSSHWQNGNIIVDHPWGNYMPGM